ncbi:hypothetical protein PVAND_006318 [Polypedilum vanderplanki]|uniref:Uncharacterized protein n=1 Tax=Polypedilum vanderplanki TaxID=319348 RepID=A0A9J6C397_POLVA|nr:hypothetical protein PVAND_006318 [Polypedilum vanderplanki]
MEGKFKAIKKILAPNGDSGILKVNQQIRKINSLANSNLRIYEKELTFNNEGERDEYIRRSRNSEEKRDYLEFGLLSHLKFHHRATMTSVVQIAHSPTQRSGETNWHVNVVVVSGSNVMIFEPNFDSDEVYAQNKLKLSRLPASHKTRKVLLMLGVEPPKAKSKRQKKYKLYIGGGGNELDEAGFGQCRSVSFEFIKSIALKSYETDLFTPEFLYASCVGGFRPLLWG